MIRETVYFEGRVQGVGFRMTTARVAKRHAVAGFVKNLPDGRVQLVAEGAAPAVRDFVDAVQAAMGGGIVNLECHRGIGTGEYGEPGAEHAFRVVL